MLILLNHEKGRTGLKVTGESKKYKIEKFVILKPRFIQASPLIQWKNHRMIVPLSFLNFYPMLRWCLLKHETTWNYIKNDGFYR